MIQRPVDSGSPKFFFILQGSLSVENFQFIPLSEGTLDNVEKTLVKFQNTVYNLFTDAVHHFIIADALR